MGMLPWFRAGTRRIIQHSDVLAVQPVWSSRSVSCVLLEAPLLSPKLSSTGHPIGTALERNEGSTCQENNFWLLY